MSAHQQERFQELAQKQLWGEATAAEREELKGLVAGSRQLKEEWGDMERNTALIRELLTLLQDVRHPVPELPTPTAAALEQRMEALCQQTEEPAVELRAALLGALRKVKDGGGRADLKRLAPLLWQWMNVIASTPVTPVPRGSSHGDGKPGLSRPRQRPGNSRRSNGVRNEVAESGLLEALEARLELPDWTHPDGRKDVWALLRLIEESTETAAGPENEYP